MSDENIIIENDQSEEIPSVGDDDAKRKNQIFIVAIIILAAIASILIFSATSEETSEKDDLEAKVEEEFKIIERELIVPKEDKKKAVVAPVFKPEPVVAEPKGLLKRPQPINEKPIGRPAVQDRDAIARQKKEEALWAKRRKASTVVYNEETKETTFSAREQAQSHQDRMDKMLDKVTNKFSGLTGGGSSLPGFGGSSRSSKNDDLSSRLQASKPERITAGFIEDRSFVLHQGTMIGCILETAISSELPGMIKCIVSEDVYSFDGSQKLLSKGSEVVGQYEGGMQHGESRIFAIWNRVITPDGISVQLDSPGTGALGRSGHSAWVDSHFLERFGSSALLSVIGGLASSTSDQDIRLEEVGKSFNQSAEIALKESIKIRPTGHKNQGERIKIFVAKDIDFKPVLSLRR